MKRETEERFASTVRTQRELLLRLAEELGGTRDRSTYDLDHMGTLVQRTLTEFLDREPTADEYRAAAFAVNLLFSAMSKDLPDDVTVFGRIFIMSAFVAYGERALTKGDNAVFDALTKDFGVSE